ncbi:purine permease 1-like isoform X1 [Iris pallida]|uniref:Purine permease 1-like isoform X1 n=1 Tax=Iris pallida TaxID=29817 RepID=A0AAX6HRP2_IRIPA|nr:purine permease 1-like isoform X1 [Iris pallida]
MNLEKPEPAGSSHSDNKLSNGHSSSLSPVLQRTLTVTSCLLLALGDTGGPLISRLYFHGGGRRQWLSCFLETAGFPLLLPPPPPLLPPPPPRRPPRRAGPHQASRLPRVRGARPADRRGRLPLRLRPLLPPGLHLRAAPLHPPRLHRGVRLPPREAEVHPLLGQLGGPPLGRGAAAGPARELGPPGRRLEAPVPPGPLPDRGRRGAVRARAGPRGAHVRQGEAEGHVHAGHRDAGRHRLLRDHVLSRGDDS